LNVLKLIEAFRNVDKTEALARLPLPCTLVHGRLDEVVELPGEVKAAASSNPNVDLRWIEDGDHYLPMSHAALVTGWLRETATRVGCTPPLEACSDRP
jgi:pimeloyl-ACP methyl ester carboxylesterase